MGNCDPYSDSPEPAVVDKPQSTRVEEPTLLCNHVPYHYLICPVGALSSRLSTNPFRCEPYNKQQN